MFGLRTHTAMAKLKGLVEAGKAKRTHKRTATSNGRIVTYVAYKLL